MAWTVTDIPDLTGCIAVVTGAKGSPGLESARALAGAGAHMVMAAKNQDRALATRDGILAAHPDTSLDIAEIDPGSLASVQAATDPRARGGQMYPPRFTVFPVVAPLPLDEKH